MKQPVQIKLCMFFDTADNIWANYFQFEADFAKFLKETKGVEAIVSKNINGQTAENYLYLKKIEEVPVPTKETKLTPKAQKNKVLRSIK